MNIYKVVFLVSLIISCNSTTYEKKDSKTERDNKNFIVSNKAYIFINKEYWSKTNPIDFLDTLSHYGDNAIFMIMEGPNENWFENKFIDSIKKIITGKNIPASIVHYSYENNLHFKDNSTTLSEAAEYMLKGYAKQKYPPSLCSYHYPNPAGKL